MRIVAILTIALWQAAAALRADEKVGTSGDLPHAVFFEQRVRPILVERCQSCHGAKKQENGLRLDSRAGVLAGGDDGAIVVSGKPDESKIIQAIRYGGDIEMPPKRKLADDQIAALTRWVELGMPWPEAKNGSDAAKPASGAELYRYARENLWSVQPIERPPLPQVKDTSWPRRAIDYYVLAKLEAAGLSPAPQADRRTLIRRATFDLVGLPPTPEEVDDFVADNSPDAYEKLIDRLLASPAYGERWGRHWLDVARYADTKGYTFGKERKFPSAFTYRDWVIKSLNADIPYDEFVVQQLAADRLLDNPPQQQAALGLLTVGRKYDNEPDNIDDQIDVVTRGFLGLTVACARCHDHKYDAIPTADYYSLYGVFASSTEPGEGPLVGSPDDGARAMSLVDKPQPFDPQVFIRGNQHRRGDRVPRQFLRVLAGNERKPFTDGSGRLELARAIVATDNPLTPRVIANRVWMHHFGQPLVATPSDFGMRSTPPVQLDVLDYLAHELTADDWSLKLLHREIMLSATYRQASVSPQSAIHNPQSKDPENTLLWRMNRRRLEFEPMRDALLAVSGNLDRAMYGRPDELFTNAALRRRSVYGFIDRQDLPNLLRAFDFASPDQSAERRPNTSVPQQSLFLMNSPFVIEQAKSLAARPEVQSPAEPRERIAAIYRLLFTRPPNEHELSAGEQFIAAAEANKTVADKLTPWQQYAQLLMLTNEFMFVD